MGPKTFLKALKIYYSAPLGTVFRQFRAGVIYFSVGLMSIFMANTYLQPSLQQEWAVFFGLALAAIGFLLALMAEVRLIIGRFVQFSNKKVPFSNKK